MRPVSPRGIYLVALLAAACAEPLTPDDALRSSDPTFDAHAVTLALDTVASGLNKPLFVTSAPGDDRLFILEQTGLIRILGPNGLRAQPFLDVRALVDTVGQEQGLLGLAFHPQYAVNGRFFVWYTELDGDTRLVEYARAGANAANPSSARSLLEIDQPADNHNGGMLAFGPDGYLYIATGDGGGSAARANGQSLGTLLGKILRIDVDGAHPYAIPPDNPFVGVAGARGEIWHYGFRNPWRFSFDRQNGRMYIGDVGQNTYEEVNIVDLGVRGNNYGWSVMEGPSCFMATTCQSAGMRLPRHWYTHDQGCSVTGGYVYRARRMPELRGTYFFGDFCTGTIWSFRKGPGTTITDLRDWTADIGVLPLITSFGENNNGELYATLRGGRLVKFVPAM